MRIISGIRKGLKLKSPEGMNTRPTTDRVKESVFNLLQFQIPCDAVLDLFAGSGALGIEAISRHCGHATFVDQNRQAVALIQENIGTAHFQESATVICKDALSFLMDCDTSFDLIFLDPPYNMGFLDPVLQKIADKSLLKENGIIVIESEENGEVVDTSLFSVRRVAKYGKTVITLLQR